MNKKYIASMVLGAVGDAMGYRNGKWEFEMNGEAIHSDAKKLGGIEKLDLSDWIVSDDTVMAIATAHALIEAGDNIENDHILPIIANHYVNCMGDMARRAPGNCTMQWTHYIEIGKAAKGYQIPYNARGGGCGAAMRAAPIGLRFPRADQYKDLIRVSVESGRITHHNPVGYLGSVAAALFTSYAIQNKPIESWGAGLLRAIEDVKEYVQSSGHEVEENMEAFKKDYFGTRWRDYLKQRNLLDGKGPVTFPKKYGVKERDRFYTSFSYSDWGGSSGHDAPLIAYDALLGSKSDWIEVCARGILHGGDNDSTGILAGSWFGVLYGIDNVPKNHYENLEKRGELEELGDKLFTLSQK